MKKFQGWKEKSGHGRVTGTTVFFVFGLIRLSNIGPISVPNSYASQLDHGPG